MKFRSLLILSFFAASSCLVEKKQHGIVISKRKNEAHTSEGYVILKHGNFKLKDQFQLKDTVQLSITKVYEAFCFSTRESFRFYQNGRVLRCIVPRSLHDDTLISQSCQCGYYSLNHDSLTIELTAMATFAFGDSYDRLVIKGKLFGDTIQFYKDQWGGSGRNIGHYGGRRNEQGKDCIYIKSDKNFSLIQPSW